jgi:hypothetical protein
VGMATRRPSLGSNRYLYPVRLSGCRGAEDAARSGRWPAMGLEAVALVTPTSCWRNALAKSCQHATSGKPTWT